MQKKINSTNSGMALVSTLLLLAMASLITLAAVQLTQLTVLEVSVAAEKRKQRFELEGALHMLFFRLRNDIAAYPERVIDTEVYNDSFAKERWQADSVPHILSVNGVDYQGVIIDAGGYYSIESDEYFEHFETLWSDWYSRGAWDFKARQNLKDLSTVLGDYTDANDTATLNGAEKDYYRRNKCPGLPRNAPMQYIDELAYVPGTAAFFPTDANGNYVALQPIAPNGMPVNIFAPNLYSTPVRWLASIAKLDEKDEKLLEEARALWEGQQKPYYEHLTPEVAAALQGVVSPEESGFYLLCIKNDIMNAEAAVRMPDGGNTTFIEYYDFRMP